MQSIFRPANRPEDLDLSRSQYDEKLTFLSFDESGFFEATIDRLIAKDFVTVLTSALQGSGFVANFENMLAMIETAEVGVRLPTSGSTSHPARFLPSMRMKHPDPQNAGLLLQSFYGIISRFEKLLKDEPAGDAKGQAERKLAQLERAFQEILREREIERARGVGTGEAVFSLSQMRQATVRRVDFEKKVVTLTIGGVVEDIPLRYCNHVPREGGTCFYTAEKPQEVYVPRKEVQIFCERSLGEVLYVADDWYKVRDGFRNEHTEYEQNSKLTAGQAVLCLHAREHFLGLEILGTYQPPLVVSATEKMAQERAKG